MSANAPERRRFMATAIGAAAALLAGPAASQQAAYSRISIDVERLRDRGHGPFADLVQANLRRAMQRAFAGRTGQRGAPVLTVRITLLQLSSFVGGGGSRRFGGSGGGSSDYMEGEALVSQGSQLIRRHPQLSAIPSSSGGAWYAPDNEQRRAVALCEHYAGWLARAL